jgi:mannosyltransferase OCH1-like enzyme
MSIDKTLIYCWFGKSEKPKKIERCINSWYKWASEYKIIEVNESNFDINMFKYTKQAYEQKRYAFVSDVARVWFLTQISGITIDADVECIKPFTNDILSNRAFTCKETTGLLISATFGAEKNHPWINLILDHYKDRDFLYSPNTETNATIIHNLNKENVVDIKHGIIYLKDGVAIYPREYFEACNWSTKQIEVTPRTYCVHRYMASWIDK